MLSCSSHLTAGTNALSSSFPADAFLNTRRIRARFVGSIIALFGRVSRRSMGESAEDFLQHLGEHLRGVPAAGAPIAQNREEFALS
jgi:hypothetical protein